MATSEIASKKWYIWVLS